MERVESAKNALLSISPRVAEAIAAGRGVVALETTLVTHGLPSPEGFEVAIALEAAVAECGAEPATIGIIDGQVRVGLDRLARYGSPRSSVHWRKPATGACAGAMSPRFCSIGSAR